MNKKPRKKSESIITKTMALNILAIGVLMTIVTLAIFYLGSIEDVANNIRDLETGDLLYPIAQTMAFTTLVTLEMVRVQMIRSHYKIGIFSNKWLIAALLSSIGLQLLVLYTPLNTIFGVVPLDLIHWGYIGLAVITMAIFGTIANKIIKSITHQED